MKGANAEQQSKKPKSEKISVFNQHKEQTDNRSKKNVICYQCNKKDHYRSQCSELTRKQFKNINQAPVREMHIKKKD